MTRRIPSRATSRRVIREPKNPRDGRCCRHIAGVSRTALIHAARPVVYGGIAPAYAPRPAFWAPPNRAYRRGWRKRLVSRHVRRFGVSASSARPLQSALAPSGVLERFLLRGVPATEKVPDWCCCRFAARRLESRRFLSCGESRSLRLSSRCTSRQRWWQLGIDEEPHFIRLSDEDRMVEILGGVLEARANILPLQIRVVSKNLIL